jgi:hypothetical protein
MGIYEMTSKVNVSVDRQSDQDREEGLPSLARFWKPALVVFLLPWVVFLPIVFKFHALTSGDHELVSKWGLLTEYLAGKSIFWTESMNGGTLLFGSTSLPFTIGDLSYFFLDKAWAYAFSHILDFSIAGLGFFLWRACSHRSDWKAALAGALVYQFSLHPVAKMAIGHQVVSSQFAWLPWMFWCVDILIRGRPGRFMLFFPPLLFLLVMATYPSTTLVFGLLLTVYLIWGCYRNGGKNWPSLGLVYGTASVLGLFLGAMILVPGLRFARECVLPGTPDFTIPDYADHLNLPIPSLLTFFLPYLYGGSFVEDCFYSNFFAVENTGAFQEFAIYSGLVPMGFLILYFHRLRTVPEARLWLYSFVVLLIISLGKYGGLYVVLKELPLLSNLRGSSRFVVAFPFLLGILTTIASEFFFKEDAAGKRIIQRKILQLGGLCLLLAVLFAGAVVALRWGVIGRYLHSARLTEFMDRYVVQASMTNIQIISIVLTLWILIHFLSKRFSPSWSVVIWMVGVLLADLWVNAYPRLWRPSGNYQQYMALHPASEGLNRLTENGRHVYGALNHCLPHNLSVLNGTREVVGFKDFVTRSYMELIGRVNHEQEPRYDLYSWGFYHFDSPLLGLMQVNVIASAVPVLYEGWEEQEHVNGIRFYKRRQSDILPEAWISGKVVVISDRIQRLDMVEAGVAMNPLKLTVVESEEDLAGIEQLSVVGEVVSQSNKAHLEYEFASKNSFKGLLCTSMAYYPEWEAWSGGLQLQTIRVNHGFIGIKIPDATKSVVLRFNPKSHQLGLRISLGSAGVWLTLALGLMFADRGRSGPSKPSRNPANVQSHVISG